MLKTGALQDAIFNSANFSCIATDESGVIQLFNVGAERMLGYAAADVVDQITPAAISDPDELIARAEALSEELGTTITPGFEALVFKASRGIEDIYELTYRRKDGSRLPGVLSVTALRDATGGIIGYLLIGTDNTARKAIETERRRLELVLQEKNEELEAARATADKANLAKSEFLSNMSHELRTPLTAILGFAELMESDRPPPTPAQADSLEQILKAGWYLLTLINEVLDLAMVESGKLSMSVEPVELTDVLNECRTMIEPQAQKRTLALSFPTLDGPQWVTADRTRVKQVLVNLLSNAIKYNQEGGLVAVTVDERPSGRVRVSVRDTGAGLDPEQVEQLFTPFNRLGREVGPTTGTGIGLVVTKRLVELMGGIIGVESTVGTGSVFWVEMRSGMAPSALGELVDAGPYPGAACTTCTVLYVEDNPANMKLVERLLDRRPDITMLKAVTGTEGLRIARTALPTVVLMDIDLPDMSGLDALAMMRADPATAQIPVVAVTANAMPRDTARGLKAGFLSYVTKPIKVSEFMSALDLAIAAAENERPAAG